MHVNRAFKYGDGLFETIRVCKGKILFLEKHFTRLSKGLKILHMQNPQMPLSIEKFEKILLDFLSKQSDANLRIRITFFRKGAGLYTPHEMDYDYFIESTTLGKPFFELNPKGFYLGFCSSVRLSIDQLSNLKTTSALPYVLAALEKKEKGWDDCLILNAKENIAESIAANVFLVKGRKVWTPSLDQGCVAGVMRQNILEVLANTNYDVYEGVLPTDAVGKVDEILLSNAIRGIQWVSNVENCSKTFSNRVAKSLIEQLNLRIDSKLEQLK